MSNPPEEWKETITRKLLPTVESVRKEVIEEIKKDVGNIISESTPDKMVFDVVEYLKNLK